MEIPKVRVKLLESALDYGIPKEFIRQEVDLICKFDDGDYEFLKVYEEEEDDYEWVVNTSHFEIVNGNLEDLLDYGENITKIEKDIENFVDYNFGDRTEDKPTLDYEREYYDLQEKYDELEMSYELSKQALKILTDLLNRE